MEPQKVPWSGWIIKRMQTKKYCACVYHLRALSNHLENYIGIFIFSRARFASEAVEAEKTLQVGRGLSTNVNHQLAIEEEAIRQVSTPRSAFSPQWHKCSVVTPGG